MDARRSRSTLAVLESVRCLECGEVYAKPAAGGTWTEPGLPDCGYVGWIPVSRRGASAAPLRRGSPRLRPRRQR